MLWQMGFKPGITSADHCLRTRDKLFNTISELLYKLHRTITNF